MPPGQLLSLSRKETTILNIDMDFIKYRAIPQFGRTAFYNPYWELRRDKVNGNMTN
jgi:hypothetical protein